MKVIVVGAGIAGMTAAIYLKRSGFDVTLIERHTIVGGMCTSWRRKGYLFEGAINWLTGSSPETELNGVWRDTGALSDDVTVYYHEPFLSMEWQGKTVCLYRDIGLTQKHLCEQFPEDAKEIARLVKTVKRVSRVSMPLMDIEGVKCENPKKAKPGKFLKMLPGLLAANRLGKISCKEYAQRFKHPALRALLGFMEPYSASAFFFTLATLNSGDGGYPEGGSLAMTGRMEAAFKALGGELLLNTKVKSVLSENGRAAGVMLEDGALTADAVIITQDTLAAVDQLFETPPKDAWIEQLRRDTKPELCTFIGVGVRADIPETPSFELDEPIMCGGVAQTRLSFNNYTGFEGYAPPGCVALTTAFSGDTYDYWKKAMEEGRYEAEKQNLAEQISGAICRKYPQAQGNIEVIDIATPLTYERYTGAYKGSWMSVMGKGDKMRDYPCSLEEISGVYFAGQRVMVPGGLPVALMTGRNAAQMVCRQFGVVFR